MGKNSIYNEKAESIVYECMTELYPTEHFVQRGKNDKTSKSDVLCLSRGGLNVSVKYGKACTLESRIKPALVSEDGLTVDGETIPALTDSRLWTKNRKQATFYLPDLLALVSADFNTIKFYHRQDKKHFTYSSSLKQSSNGQFYLTLFHVEGPHTTYKCINGEWKKKEV